jgi:succinyl-diaminopimelate desuccinylase
MTDSVSILQDLIRCKSVTPNEGGALDYLEKLLTANGFTCYRLKFSDKDTPDVDNLYARRGTAMPHLCFAGHTDVVPIGDENLWTCDPFGGTVRNEQVWGRGACDMKGAIAAFVAAALDSGEHGGSLSFLITGDEEGPSINGTKKVLEWLEKQGEKIDFCIVGEPTSRETLGDMLKIGRRGTFTGRLTITGKQGHVAYPHLADNPVPKLLALLKAIDDLELDKGTAHFQPSNLEIVNIEIGNKAENVIPAAAHAVFNVRFNDQYTGATLEKKLRDTLDTLKIPYHMDVRIGGESFYTPPGRHSNLLRTAIKKITGLSAEISTSGGTSDARFIKKYCPVVEFGIVGKTAHQIDEHVAVKDMHALTEIYKEVIRTYTL